MMRVPRLVAGCDIKALPLKTEEAYLLSRIDGVVSERELSLITGLSPAEVSIALDRLVVLGAVEFGDARPPVSRRGSTMMTAAGVASTRGSEMPSSRAFDPPLSGGPPPSRRFVDAPVESPPASRRFEHGSDQPPPPTRRSFDAQPEWRVVEPVVERVIERRPAAVQEVVIEPPPPTRRGAEISIEPPRILPVEVDDQLDIDHAKKKKILELYEALESRTHYELLELPMDADKKRVKSAYYSIAPEFHPDKYFRKRLGHYKAKIEAIFARLTLAHDVLTSKQRRAEYDAYLEQLRRNRTMAALLEHDPAIIPAVVAAADEDPMSPPPTARGRNSSDGDAPGPESARSRRPVMPKPAPMVSSRRSLEGQPSGASGPSAGGDAGRRIDTARPDPRRLQLERYLLAAKVALERKDLAAAANAYRLAAALAPDDEALVRKALEVQRTASSELSEGFLKQAEYEASQGRWAEAAASFANGCRTRQDDARLHERVAFATLKTGQNARRAVDYARRAVKLAPQVPEYRITLVRAYIAAGLETSARAEVDRIADLAPNDAKMRDAIAQLRMQIKKADSNEP
ncbi:MAG: DnaJ domain-containing protein [Polyangiaceae bacterium]|nr:DnaJ domain-containing protein [Polyangiaceae bacterium]